MIVLCGLIHRNLRTIYLKNKIKEKALKRDLNKLNIWYLSYLRVRSENVCNILKSNLSVRLCAAQILDS